MRSPCRRRSPPVCSTPTDASRHTRVTRWDQTAPAVDAAGGVITVPAAAGTPIVLEDGVADHLRRRSGGRRPSHRRLLGLRRAHGRRLGPGADRRAAASGSTITTAALAVVTVPGLGHRLPHAALQPSDGDGCACDVCVTPESHASGAMTIQHAVDIVHAPRAARSACRSGSTGSTSPW